MNTESTNYEDRIKFLITLMIKDYAKAHNIGNQLLKNNHNNADVIRALRILKHRECGKIKQWSTLNSVNSQVEFNNKCEGNDSSTDFVDDNTNIYLGSIIGSKSILPNMSRLNNNENNNLDYKPKMYRVMQIKMNNKQHT